MPARTTRSGNRRTSTQTGRSSASTHNTNAGARRQAPAGTGSGGTRRSSKPASNRNAGAGAAAATSSRTRGASGRRANSAEDRRAARRRALLDRDKEVSKRVNASGIGFFKADMMDSVPFWKCDAGDHVLDVIPYIAGNNDPDPRVQEGDDTYGLYVYEHRDVGGKEGQSMICLETYGEKCPICIHRRQLERDGADAELIKSLRTSRYPRSIYNIICYDGNEEDKGIQVWHTSYFLFEKHLKKLQQNPVRRRGSAARVQQEERGDIPHWTDPDEGKSVAFTREGERENTRFIGHRLLDRDYAIEDELIERAYPLDQLIHKPTFAEVYEAYWGEEYSGEDMPSGGGGRRSTNTRRRRPKSAEVEDEPLEEIPEDLEDEHYDDEDLPPEEEEELEEEIPEDLEDELPPDDEGEEADGGEAGDCPGEFGVDFDTFDECDNCPDFDACKEEFEQESAKPAGRGKRRR